MSEVARVTVVRVRFERVVMGGVGGAFSRVEVVEMCWNLDSWPLNEGVGGSVSLASESR